MQAGSMAPALLSAAREEEASFLRLVAWLQLCYLHASGSNGGGGIITGGGGGGMQIANLHDASSYHAA
jgi:hypothetical protein